MLYLDLITINTEKDLFASNIDPDAVWNKQFLLPPELAIRGTEYCCATLNMSVMVASQNDRIFMFDFITQ